MKEFSHRIWPVLCFTAEWGEAGYELHSCPDMTVKQGGKRQVAAASKLSSMKAGKPQHALLVWSVLYTHPTEDLNNPFYVVVKRRHSSLLWGISGQGSTIGFLILSMLLRYRLAELPLCPSAHRLNEAIYSPMYYGLKCTTTLQGPNKDKGCHIFGRMVRSGALCSLTVALRNCGQQLQKRNCSVGWL